MSDVSSSSRREFVKVAGTAAIGASLFPHDALGQSRAKRRYAIVGTGDRGSGMWGRDLVQRYPDLLEFVGPCDVNPKRDLIFRKTDAPEYMRLPDSRAGAMSCLTGIAIRNSIDEKRPIKIADLVKL